MFLTNEGLTFCFFLLSIISIPISLSGKTMFSSYLVKKTFDRINKVSKVRNPFQCKLLHVDKEVYGGGCQEIPSSDECCKYLDGRKDTIYYHQPCVAVQNVTSPTHDKDNPCQSLCFAKNQCGKHFIGDVSNSCDYRGIEKI